jgi:predicted Zn-dependent peptidase
MGGVFNAFTSKDHTGYWIKGTVDKVPTMLDVLSDMVTASKLETVEIEKEKGVIVEEMKMYEDMPQAKVANMYDQLLYDGHPLGRDIIGNESTVKSFTRETFTSYIQKLYHPENAVLVIAGGIKGHLKEMERAIEETFGLWKSVGASASDFAFELYRPTQNKLKLVHTKQTEQAHFVFGYTVDFGFSDEKRYALGLLAAILGGGMSSRLFMEVREKRGLCYYVHTSRDQYAETGSLATAAGVRCDKDTVNQALALIIQEHMKIAAGKDKDRIAADLKRAQTMTKGRLLLSMEDSQSVGGLYATKYLLEHQMADIHESIKKIESVQVEDIIALAADIVIKDRMRVAVVGPFQDGDLVLG